MKNYQMRSPATIIPLTVIAAFLLSAHGGGLDRYGCHYDRKRGGYHCHRGPMSGQSFMSKDEAVRSTPTSPSQTQKIIRGEARIVDGDTLVIHGTRVRLYGIDAPESRQTCQAEIIYQCGKKAATALSDKIGRQVVVCEKKDIDRYGRIISICRLNGEDLNSWMVLQGHALAYRRYSKDYIKEEKTAQQNGAGIWAGTFEPPWLWRKNH